MWNEKASASCNYGKLLDSYADLILNNEDTELYELDNDVENDERLQHHIDAFKEFIENHIDGKCEYIGREIPVC